MTRCNALRPITLEPCDKEIGHSGDHQYYYGGGKWVLWREETKP